MKLSFFRLTRPDNVFTTLERARGMNRNRSWTDSKGVLHGGNRICPLTVDPPKDQHSDFLWTGVECVVRDRVRSEFQKQQVTGVEFDPVFVSRSRQWREEPLWEPRIVSCAGQARPESGIHLISDDENGPRYSKFTDPSQILDIRNWDGSDFFFVWPMPRYFLVAERVVTLVTELGFRGCQFIPLSELRQTSVKFFSPGQLSFHLPDHLAKKYSEKFKIPMYSSHGQD